MRSLLYSVLLLSFLAAFPLLAAWQPFPAGHPPVYSLISDSSGQRITLSCLCGPLQTTDNGQSWIDFGDRFPGGTADMPYRLEIVNANADTILAADFFQETRVTGQNSAISFDGGLTWQAVEDEAGYALASLSIWQRDHSVWFYLWDGVLYRSHDFGNTWPFASPFPGVMFIIDRLIQTPQHDSTFFAICNPLDCSHLVWRSDDLGESWTAITSLENLYGADSGMRVRDIADLSDGSLIALVSRRDSLLCEDLSSAWRSSDNGESWQEITVLQNSGRLTRVIEDATLPGTLYTLHDDPVSLLRSTDFGATWDVRYTGQWERNGVDLRQNVFSGTIYLLAGEAGILLSADHGETWQQGSGPLCSGSASGELAAVGGAMFYGDENDRGWWELDPSQGEWQRLIFPRGNCDTAIVAGQILRRRGPQLTVSTRLNIGEYPDFQSITYFLNSSDNGQSWIFGPQCSHLILSAYSTETTTRIIGYDEGLRTDILYVTSDLGQNWSPLHALPTPVFASANIGMTTAQSATETVVLGRDWREDGAREFVFRYTGPVNGWQTILEQNEWRLSNLLVEGPWIFAADTVDHMLKFWAGGVWGTRGPLPFAANPNFEFVVTDGPPHRLVAVRHFAATVWVSDDYGTTWTEHSCELPYGMQQFGFADICYDRAAQRIWISTRIGPCFIEEAELNVPDGPLHLQPANHALIAAYPNPFNSETQISFRVVRDGTTTLDVYNLEGRLVERLADGFYAAGTHAVRWRAADLASGVYLARLTTGKSSFTTKLILLR